MSYINVIMYNAVIPSYNSKEKDNKELINADDPKNQQKINKIINL